MKKNLVFSPQEQFKDNISINYYPDYYFYNIKNYNNSSGIEIDDFKDLDKRDILKKKYLENSFTIFCNILNKNIFQKKDLTISYWDIILKHWFEIFFDTYVQRYLTIEKVLKDNEFDSVTLLSNYSKHLETDYSHEIFKKCQDDNWNYCLLQIIYCDLNKNRKIKENFIDIKFVDKIKPNKKKFKRNLLFFYNQIGRFLNLYNSNQSIFINSYLGIKKEVIFQLKLKQFPYILSDLLYNHIILSESYNSNLRNNISNKIENEEYDFFTKIFLKSVITFLPKSFLEGYNEIEYYQKRFFHTRNVKFIFSSSSYSFDDIFKRYMANEKREFHTKLVIGQHGMGYPLEKKELHSVSGVPRIELKFCDYYLTWGSYSTRNSNKFYDASVLFNRKYLIDYKKSNLNKKIVQFIQPHREAQYKMYNTKKFFLDFLNDVDNLLSILDKKITENLFVKIHPNDYQNLIIKNLWLDKIIKGRVLSNIDKEFNLQKQKNINQKTKLFIFNYISTGFLECISQNIPCMMYASNNYEHFDNNVKGIIQALIDCNVIFNNYDDLNYFLINNWERMDKWWKNDTLQMKIKEFSTLFARKHNQRDIFSILNKIHD